MNKGHGAGFESGLGHPLKPLVTAEQAAAMLVENAAHFAISFAQQVRHDVQICAVRIWLQRPIEVAQGALAAIMATMAGCSPEFSRM